MDALVSSEWLAAETGASDLRIVDASCHLAESGRDAAAEYRAAHIPGAVFMDLAGLVDPRAAVENTAPPATLFASRMQALGLGDGSRIVLYDDSAIRSAARAWFLLRMFGARDVAILDGGLGKWRAEQRPLEAGTVALRARHFTAWESPGALRGKAEVLANLASGREQIVDARSPARFSGAQPDPRPGVAAGHIPGARNLHYARLFQADGSYRPTAEIPGIFAAAGVDLNRPLITSCGSGMTACVLAFALALVGKLDVTLYDGSWSEWGADPATPKVCNTVPA
ncbi:MAG: 3-mercaptopyruvate sulfurtransferase [Sphingomonadales bacterium]|nr:3-mercaptopyruvate sulfurtransferase [Sphingomonadales bacterium]